MKSYGKICVLVAVLIVAGMTIDYRDRYAPAEVKPAAAATPGEQQMAGIFEKHGSPAPEQMAKAVLHTKRPHIMAAIALRESDGDPTAVGDRGASVGAFQIQPKHHGPVPVDPVAQALKAERILEDLLLESRGRLRCALAKYNGGTRPGPAAYRYADWVIKKAGYIKHGYKS